MANKDRESRQINIQLSEEEDGRLDDEIERRKEILVREHPGLRPTKTEIARSLLLERLAELEEQS